MHPPQHNDKSQINGLLFVDNVHTPSAYEALSYTWGDITLTHRILLSGEDDSGTIVAARSFQVGANAFDALRELRLRDKPLILWVDAICIDQSNVEEKNAQVAMMSTIYRNSHRVLLWLGLADTHSDRVFSNLHRAFSPNFFPNHDQDSKTDTGQGLTPSTLWKAFSHLLSRPF